MTIADIEQIFTDQLPGFYDNQEKKGISTLVVQHVCAISKSYYLLHKKKDLTLTQEASIIRMLDELRFGKPVQQVLGEADFFGLKFKVNSSVLIPRPETEELVDWILNSIKADKILFQNILDIGAGSGCISVALKKNLPDSNLFALDLSQAALEIVRQNCILNAVNVELIHGDIHNTALDIEPLSFNIIVSNPPYITLSEKQDMDTHVLEHEPHSALFVPDKDPLLFYRSIIRFSLNHLDPDGLLFLEINESYDQQTITLLKENGYISEIKRDLQGKKRMIKAWRAL